MSNKHCMTTNNSLFDIFDISYMSFGNCLSDPQTSGHHESKQWRNDNNGTEDRFYVTRIDRFRTPERDYQSATNAGSWMMVSIALSSEFASTFCNVCFHIQMNLYEYVPPEIHSDSQAIRINDDSTFAFGSS